MRLHVLTSVMFIALCYASFLERLPLISDCLFFHMCCLVLVLSSCLAPCLVYCRAGCSLRVARIKRDLTNVGNLSRLLGSRQVNVLISVMSIALFFASFLERFPFHGHSLPFHMSCPQFLPCALPRLLTWWLFLVRCPHQERPDKRQESFPVAGFPTSKRSDFCHVHCLVLCFIP